ncbi:hypothetical protein LXA43DRAFT_1007031 [Ganoderma leucocontextum]|nr:hypothetical protein LXA43DRAFT_1007031 [Ganoderma leucocontextum]
MARLQHDLGRILELHGDEPGLPPTQDFLDGVESTVQQICGSVSNVGDCDACGTGHLVPLWRDHRGLCAPATRSVELQPRKGTDVHASRAAEA